MANLHEKLRQYRQQKRRKETLEYFKFKIQKFWMLGTGAFTSQGKCQTTIDIKAAQELNTAHTNICDTNHMASTDDEDLVPLTNHNVDARNESVGLKYTLWGVYFLLWVTLYVIAIELQFGSVFLMFSALLAIYLNTRTGPREFNEKSAYSVFNKNCESIDGTLTAEQFQNEILYGSGSK